MGPMTIGTLIGVGAAAIMDLCTPIAVFTVMEHRKKKKNPLDVIRHERGDYEKHFRKNKGVDF